MAKCKNCGKWGMLLRLSQYGLCAQCDFVIRTEVEGHARVVRESAEIVKTSKNTATVISRLDGIREHLVLIMEYEKRGIQVFDTSATKTMMLLESEHDEFIVRGMMRELEDVVSKLANLKKLNAKRNRLYAFRERIEQYQKAMRKPEAIGRVNEMMSEAFARLDEEQDK